MTDAWVRRDAGAYAEAIAGELPTGAAWPRDPDGDLMRWVDGCAGVWGDVSGRAADLLVTETDPRFAFAMLPDWERAFGLPDPCVAEPLTLADRHKALLTRMTAQGGQSRAFFLAVAAALGYTVFIREYSPFMAGISRAGDTRPRAPQNLAENHPRWMVGAPEMRFYWTVYVLGARTRWFRAGSGQAGVDPMVRIGLATDLECVVRRWSPAHTQVIFNYGLTAPAYDTFTWFRAGTGRAGTDHLLEIVEHGGIVDT